MDTSPPPVLASKIPFAHWSMKVGRTGPAWGEIVDQIADVEQGIANLIFTPKGAVPTEPTKGCDIFPYMDRPPAIAVPALKVEIWEVLFVWHKRIRLQEVDVVLSPSDAGDLSHYTCPIFWFPVDGVLQDDGLSEPFVTNVSLSPSGLAAAGIVLQ